MKSIILDNFSRRNEFIQMLRERGAKYGVEVGTDRGKYAEQLLKGIPGLKLTCVDPWVPYTEGKEIHDQANVDQIYEEAKKRLYPLVGSKIMKMTSMEAVRWLRDDSLDFVFIDGNHEYDHVLEDITQWTKKVKLGGIVCGHDYKEDLTNNYGVIEAVTKYVKDNHVSPLFILRKRGLVDCWMFFREGQIC